MKRLRWILTLLLVTAACGSDEPPKMADMGTADEDMPTIDMPDPGDTDPPGDLDVVLRPRGAGAEAYTDGQEVELVSGFQGGYHIDVNLAVDELPAEANGIARARVRRVADGQRFAGVTAELFAENWRVVSDGIVYSLPPLTTDGFAYPDEAIGERIELEVTVTMDDGAEDRDVIELVLIDDIDELG